jgi:hypothetical protein
VIAACIAMAVALVVWALVIQDLGRRLIRHADVLEERRRLAMAALDVAAIERRLVKLEQADRQTVNALTGRR